MTKAVIVIHGGAGTISRAQRSPEKERQYIAALSAIVETGQKMLNAGESALDVVTEAVRLLKSVRCLTRALVLFLPAMKPMSWTPA
jgi:beta-aspartyl-peptidase (threonine type)